MRRLVLGLIILAVLMMGGSATKAEDYSWLFKQGPVLQLDRPTGIFIYPYYNQYGPIYQYPYTYRSPLPDPYDSPVIIVPARPCELWQLRYPWLRCE